MLRRAGEGGKKQRARALTQLESLSINISNVHTSLVGEKDLISIPHGVDANVVLSVRRMGKEGLDDEGVEGSGGLLDLL